MDFTRRDCLKASALVGMGAALAPSLAAAADSPGDSTAIVPPGKGTLVIVQMAGGNDGLNTVVPYNDGRYYDLRPGLALAPEDVIPLDGERGLHPALSGFKDMWDQDRLAIVEGVAYPGPSFSHFQSMDIWRSGSPGGRRLDGWLGRYFERYGGGDDPSPFLGLAVGHQLPMELMTPMVSVPIVQNVESYRLLDRGLQEPVADLRLKALLALNEAHRSWSRYGPILDDTLRTARDSAEQLAEADRVYEPKVDYPDTRLGRDLSLLAAAIVEDLGVRVGHVSIGGFDTHAGQRPTHERLLTELSEAVTAFYRDVQAHGRDQDVLVMSWSEFGRRARSNASGGTDHGWAAPLFLMGAPVRGGRYGKHPDLGRLDQDNLVYTTDFRSVYASVLEDWLGVPQQEVLDGGPFETLPVLTSGGQ